MLMKKAKLFLAALSALLSLAASAQDITVTGTVTEASTGEGVPFASVMVKGTMNGVASNVDGVYSIVAPENGTLVFSAVGYTTVEVAVNSAAEINVELDVDNQFLDETIVVAYGTATRESFTGSATMVDSGETSQRVTS